MISEFVKPVPNPEEGKEGSEVEEPSGGAPEASGKNFDEDPRFEGKTPEEKYGIHRNLELEHGRMTKEVSDLRKDSEIAKQVMEKLLTRDASATPITEPEKPRELTEDEIQNYRDNPHIIRNEILGAVQEMITQNTALTTQTTNRVAVDNLLRNEFGARYAQVKPEIEEFLNSEPGVLSGRDPSKIANYIARYVRGGRNSQGLNNPDKTTDGKPPVITEGVTTGAPAPSPTGQRGGVISAEEEEWLNNRGWSKEQIETGRGRLRTNPLKRGFKGS